MKDGYKKEITQKTTPTGRICPLCEKGEVIHEVQQSWETERVGHIRRFLGKFFEIEQQTRTMLHQEQEQYCNACGVVFKFTPPEVVEEPRKNGMVQIRPGLWMSNKKPPEIRH